MISKAVTIGEKFPYFCLPSTRGKETTNSDFVSEYTVVFIYPKDNTSSCTREALNFSNELMTFQNLKTSVFGLSKDNIASHEKFIEKHSLEIPLISDVELKLIKPLNSWVEKSMYGKVYWGVERSTFLLSKDQNILKIWRRVKVNNHVNDVIEAIKNFN